MSQKSHLDLKIHESTPPLSKLLISESLMKQVLSFERTWISIPQTLVK